MNDVPGIAAACPRCLTVQPVSIAIGEDRITENEKFSYEFDFEIDFPCGYRFSGTVLWKGLSTPALNQRLGAMYRLMVVDFQSKSPQLLRLHMVDPAEWSGPLALHNN